MNVQHAPLGQRTEPLAFAIVERPRWRSWAGSAHMFRSVKNRKFFPQTPWMGSRRSESYERISTLRVRDRSHSQILGCDPTP
jgi:hypothetical protein